MSIISRINQLLSQPEPTGFIGVCLQQQTITFCSIDEGKSAEFHRENVIDNQYEHALSQSREKISLTGQCHLVLSAKQNQIVQVDKPKVPANEINAAVKCHVISV